MDVVSSSQSSVEIQIGLFDTIIDLLLIKPIFLLGIIFIGILLVVIFRKDSSIPKVRTSILSLVIYYYLCVMLTHIVGIPTLSEYKRLSRLGEAFFNPNINTLFIGFGLSLFIEIIQLFTLYRATDIDDILTNVIGTMVGYLCFRLIAKLRIVKLHSNNRIEERDYTVYILIVIMIVSVVLGFFS